MLAALLAALGKAKPCAQTDFGCPGTTKAHLKIELKLLKTLRGWGFKGMSGYPNTPTSSTLGTRVKKNPMESRRVNRPPTSSTKLLLLNSLGQLQVGHKDVCIFRIKSLIG